MGSPAFIAAKVVLDEGVFGPIHVLGFFAYMTMVEGGSWQVCMSCSQHLFLLWMTEGHVCLQALLRVSGS